MTQQANVTAQASKNNAAGGAPKDLKHSRVGKIPVEIPKGVTVAIANGKPADMTSWVLDEKTNQFAAQPIVAGD
jgi:hypothetical protein